MCNPGQTVRDIEREAEAMANGSKGGVGDGERYWDVFWKVLSLLVLPWATAMTWMVFNLSIEVARLTEIMAYSHLNMSDRIEALETSASPDFIFYRSEGNDVKKRLDELESIHPRVGTD